jgi:hypothetical protein
MQFDQLALQNRILFQLQAEREAAQKNIGRLDLLLKKQEKVVKSIKKELEK